MIAPRTRIVDDPDELAELFGRDRHNHVYALADLEEPFWSASTWWRRGDAAFGLVGLPDGARVVYAVSSADPDGTLDLARELAGEVPPALVTGVRGITSIFEADGRQVIWQRGYHRFHLTDRAAVPHVSSEIVPLGPADAEEALALYAVVPDAAFFLPSMLEDDTFVGIRRDGELAAIAGTHVFSERHGVAAVGAVFTHPSWRGHGFGTAVTAGVIDRIGDRVPTIGLNCTDRNLSARRIYLGMGFTTALAYDECEIG